MDQWHYARAGQQLGPVGEDELRRLLSSGEISLSDLVWKAGMPQWMPAGQLPELRPPGAPPIPPPIPAQPVGYYAPSQPPPYAPSAQDQSLKWIVPVGRSGQSIAAGYLGLLGLGCGLLAPIAIVFAILSLKDFKRNPTRLGKGRAITGLILGIIGTLLWGLVLIGSVANHRF